LRHAHAAPTATNTSKKVVAPTPAAIATVGASAAVVVVASSVDDSTIVAPETVVAPVVVTDVVVARAKETDAVAVGRPFVDGVGCGVDAEVGACVDVAVVGKAAGEQSCLGMHTLAQTGAIVVQFWRKVSNSIP
jgi:hypothetical protein